MGQGCGDMRGGRKISKITATLPTKPYAAPMFPHLRRVPEVVVRQPSIQLLPAVHVLAPIRRVHLERVAGPLGSALEARGREGGEAGG